MTDRAWPLDLIALAATSAVAVAVVYLPHSQRARRVPGVEPLLGRR